MSNAAKNIVKGGSYAFLGLLGGAILQYGYNIMLARTYGADLTGIFAFGLSIANIGFVIGQLGTGETFLKYIAAYRGTNNDSKLKGLFYFSFPIVTIGIILITVVLYQSLDSILIFSDKLEFKSIIIKFILLIVPLGIVQVLSRVFQGLKRLDLMVITREIGKPASILICLFLSIIIPLDFDTFIEIYLISSFLLAGLSLYIAYNNISFLIPHKSTFKIKEWRSYMLTVTIIDIFGAISSSWIDILVLGFLLTAADVGIYFTAIRIALLSTLALIALNAIFSPIIADLWQKRNIKELDKSYKLTTRWSIILVCPASILIILLSDELMLMFGDDFAEGGLILTIIVIGRLFNGFTGGVSQMLVMSRYQKIEMYNTFFTIVLWLSCLFIFVPKYGIISAAIINASVIALLNTIKIIQVKYLIGIQPYEIKLFKILLSSTIALVLSYFIKNNIVSSSNNLMIILATALIFGITYLIALVALKLEEEDMQVVNTAKSFIFNKFRK